MFKNIKMEEIKAMSNKIVGVLQVEGYDKEDLVMEGVLEGVKALNNFDDTKGVKLSTYIYTCIKYRILYLKRLSKAQKRNPAIKINLESTIIEETGAFYGKDLIVLPSQEQEYRDNEFKESIKNSMKSCLNIREQEIFSLLIRGFTTKEIAKIFGYDVKKLSNKIGYMKRKIRKNKENIEKY